MSKPLINWRRSAPKAVTEEVTDLGPAQKIVDSSFYCYRYRDVAENGMDPYLHFTKFGWKEGRDPNPFTHTQFVQRMYPDSSTSFEEFVTTVCGSIYHNALMRAPATLEEINAAAAVGDKAYAEIFNFDIAAYWRAQKDVALRSHLDPIQHLFYDGLHQNRLRSGNHLIPELLDIDRYDHDYDFLVNQSKPLKSNSFATLNLSGHLKEAEVDTSDVVLGVGTLFYNNDMGEITRLLRSYEANLRECSFPCQLHIWDNSPEPMDPAALAEICPGLDIIFAAHPENPGFSKGHNGLMQECFDAGCTHYLGLNPDGHLLPKSVENLIRFAKTKPKPALIEMDAEPLSHPKWYHPVTGRTHWVSGAAFLLDARAYELTGGFDPDFPMYCEDVDLSFRAFQAGVGLYVAPNARYYHDTCYRFYTPEPWRQYRSLIGSWYLCEKWGDAIRANAILREIERQKNIHIPMPRRPVALTDVDPKIKELLAKDRFARSRFWGG
jgi:N-acetylglucosaminyl-diphospho-decaprenol L-rhamnosyltransferase|tara:strand:+ start:1806 stop:3284 length:1479 start_codon:yes stop_codon:yes gene_type:complete